MPRPQLSTLPDWTLVIVFLAAIALPLAGSLSGLAPRGASAEKRELAPAPRLAPDAAALASAGKLEAWRTSLAAFPAGFDEYHDDRFGFRPALIRLHNLFKACVIGVSPSDQAVIGRDGWLFYAGQQALDYYRATELLTSAELAAWELRVEAPAEWLADRGIPFVFYFAPDKATIYPEELPYFVRRVGARSRLDQFLEHLGPETCAVIVDPRADFRAAKGADPLYRKTDTHWNQAGALVAYQALARALVPRFPALDPLDAADFERRVQEMPGGDIAGVMNLSDVFREQAPQLVPRTPWPYRKEAEGLAAQTQPDVERNPDREIEEQRRAPMASVRDDAPELPRLVLFRDSYGTELITYLAASTSRGAYYWQFTVDPKVIARERPDVVVQEIGERVLMFPSLPPVPEEYLVDFERRRAFQAASRVAALDAHGGARWTFGPDGSTAIGNGDGFPARFTVGPAPFTIAIAFPEPPSADLTLRLDVETPGATALTVRAGGEPCGERVLTLGRDVVYFEIPAARSASIELELAAPPGELVLRGLELRRGLTSESR